METMPTDSNTTTIRLEKETKEKLGSLGKKGDTYDSILQHILKELK